MECPPSQGRRCGLGETARTQTSSKGEPSLSYLMDVSPQLVYWKRFKRKVSDALPKSFGGRRDEERQSDTRGAQHEDRDGRMDDRRQREDRPRPSNRERDSDGGGRDGGRGWGERRDRPQDESRDRPRQSRDGQGETRDRPKASTEPKPPQMEEEVGVWKRGASVNHTAQQATPTLPEPRAPTQPPPSAPSAGPSTNQSVAEMLRAKLLGRQAIPAPTHPPRDSSSSSTGGPMKVAPLDRQGRVLSKLTSASGDVTLAKEDLRHGRRKGLLKKHVNDSMSSPSVYHSILCVYLWRYRLVRMMRYLSNSS